MFIGVLELFKIGIGPSSSHTVGPMLAALDFRKRIIEFGLQPTPELHYRIQCVLKGSLAFTGKGHATDRAIVLGIHGHSPLSVVNQNIRELHKQLWLNHEIVIHDVQKIQFVADNDIIFDLGLPLPEHPNGLIFNLIDPVGNVALSEIYFSIGGGFIVRQAEVPKFEETSISENITSCSYAFDSAASMLQMSEEHNLRISEMKRINELARLSESALDKGIGEIWVAMKTCINNGLSTEGILSGGLKTPRRAKKLFEQLQAEPHKENMNEWLCVYAMAVNEENAAGHMVVTAPTNGAAGVIPSVLYYFIQHENGTSEQVVEFFLVAAAIGGLIKHCSSISGAEVGCQGEVGSAAAMAAAGLCAVRGGTTQQIENAAEIALEHHLGMTCDPVNGLVQIPCIERNGFGAIKAYAAASLALRGSGQHIISLDNCIAAMKQTGLEMSTKYKETSLGGLAVNFTEC